MSRQDSSHSGRERTFHLEAVVLRHLDWGEADRLITLFSRQRGKIRAVAKGVRKLRSRKAGHLEPFTIVNLLLARGRDLPIITQAESQQNFHALREDLSLMAHTSYVIEMLDRFTYEEGENLSIYHLLTDTLKHLSDGQEPDFVLRYYDLRLLELVGFRPQLFNCTQCGRDIQAEDQFFSNVLGGVVCPDCGRQMTDAHPVSMAALKYLRHLQRSSYADARRAVIPSQVLQEMQAILQRYVTYHLERRLNTPDFIHQITK